MLRLRLRSFKVKRAFDRLLGEPLARQASIVVATSKAEARELAAAGIEPSRIRLRYNGVQLEEVFPLPEKGRLRSELGIAADVPLLLTIGRIAAIKGLGHIAQAVARLPTIHWLVAGPDEGDGTLEALQRTIRQLQINSRVIILGDGLWGGAKAEALADADAFCMASENESFGSAAAEAACVGLPLAMAENCGVLDCVAPEAVRTFRYGDADGIAAAVTWPVHDPEASRAAVKAAEDLRRELDWNAVVQQQVAIYEEMQRRPRALSASE